MRSVVTIRRCATLPEALICHAMLQDRGILSAITNCGHASIDWWSVPAFNGIGIDVPTSQFEEAKQAIIEAVETGPALLESEFGPYELPRKYGRAAVWFYWLNFFGVTLVAMYAAAWVLDAILPDTFVRWLISYSSPQDVTDPYIYYTSRDGYSYNADFNFEGLFFLIVIVLVFLADSLIKPPQAEGTNEQ